MNENRKGRTPLKKRLISGLLALTMVLSLLPGGLIPEAEAIGITSSQLTIDENGNFTATFTGSSGNWGQMYFVLVPDIKVGSTKKFVTEAADPDDDEAVLTASRGTLADFETNLLSDCGFGFNSQATVSQAFTATGTYPVSGLNITVSGATVTVKGKIPSGILEEVYSGHTKNGSLSYVAFLRSGQNPVGMGHTTAPYAPTGLKITPENNVVAYQYNPSSYEVTNWVVNGSDKLATWANDEDEDYESYIEVTFTNLGADTIYLMGFSLNESKSTCFADGEPESLNNFVIADTFDEIAYNEGVDLGGGLYAIEIEGNGSVTLKIGFVNATGSPVASGITGTFVVVTEWADSNYNDQEPEEFTIVLTTDNLAWEFPENENQKQGPAVINASAKFGYQVAEVTGTTTTLKWTGGNGTIEVLPTTISMGSGVPTTSTNYSTLKYVRTRGNKTLAVGDDLIDGDIITVTFTPALGGQIKTSHTGAVTVTASSTPAAINVNFTVEPLTADTTVTVKRNGNAWTPEGDLPQIQLRKSATDPNPIDGNYTGNVWKADGTLGDSTGESVVNYQVWVKDKNHSNFANTFITIPVTYGTSTNIDLNFYDIQLATKATGGSATAAYSVNDGTRTPVSQPATGNAQVATILANAVSADNTVTAVDTGFNSNTVALTTTPDTNFTYGWTATNQANTGTFSSTTTSPSTWTLKPEYVGTGPIVLNPNFARSGVSAVITVNLNGTGTNGLAVSISENTNAQGTGAKTGSTATIDSANGKVKFDGLKASTKYYVTVTTTGYTGVHSFTTPANADGTTTLNYYTVAATAGTGALSASTGVRTDASGAVSSSLNFLSGTTAYFASAPDTASGYGGSASWSGTINGTASSTRTGDTFNITVSAQSSMEATYLANQVQVKVFLNGALDTAGTMNPTLTLKAGATTLSPDAALASGVATFSNVVGGTEYEVYVGNVATGIKVTATGGVRGSSSPSATLYYYDVYLRGPVTNGTASASYTQRSGGATVTKNAGTGTTATSDQLITTILINATDAFNDHTFSTTATRDNNNYDWNWKTENPSGTVLSVGTWSTPAAATSTWEAPTSYTAANALVLDPNIASNGNYSATITVKLNGSVKAEASVTLTPVGSALAPSPSGTVTTDSSGVASFNGLNGSYTISVSGTGSTGTTVVTYNMPSSATGLTSDSATRTLEFFEFDRSVTTVTTNGANQGTIASGSTANGIYYTGMSVTATGTPNAGYHVKQYDATVGGTTTTVTTNPGKYGAVNIAAKTSVVFTFEPNTPAADPKNLAATYGTDVGTHVGIKMTTQGYDPNTTGTYKYSNIRITQDGNPAELPFGLTLHFGEGTNSGHSATSYSGTNQVTVTGRPAVIVPTDHPITVTCDVEGPNGGTVSDVSFTITVAQYNSTFTAIHKTGCTDPHYNGDPATPPVGLTVAGPYYDGSTAAGQTYDASKWVNVTATNLGPVDLDYDKTTLTGTSGNCPVTVTGSVDTTTKTGYQPLATVWTNTTSTAQIPMSGTGTVIVNVMLNGGDYAAKSGKTVELKSGTTLVKNGGGTLAADSATAPTKETVTLSNVPTTSGSTKYNVYVDGSNVTTTAVATGNNTVNVNYYTYKFDANKPATAPATNNVSMGTIPTTDQIVLSGYSLPKPTTDPTLPGYTFKGWSLNDSTSTDGSWDSGNQTINSGPRTYYATWAENPISVTPGNHATTYGVAVAAGTALNTAPTVTKPHSSDTITYKVGDGGATTTWGSSHTIDGITLTATSTGWTISGTPTRVGTGSVVFDIQVTSALTGKSATNKVTVTIAKAPIDHVTVTDVTVPDPGDNQDKTATLPESDSTDSSTYEGYVDNTTGNDTATVTWGPNDDPFKYGKAYTSSVTVKPDDNHYFVDNPTGTVNGETATSVTKNANGTVTVTYTFPAVYKLVYDPNGGTLPTGGTQPPDQKIKVGDAITIAANPGYTKAGWKGNKFWSYTATGASAFTFGESKTVDAAMVNKADSNGVITLYYAWESSAMAVTPVDLDAVYDMDNTQWTTGNDVVYQSRKYDGLVAPGAITVTGDSVAYENLTYALVKVGNFNVSDYFEIVTTGTGAAKRASLKLKDGKKIPAVPASDYQFQVKVTNTNNSQSATGNYTLHVRPIELDHANLAALAAPAQGATPVASLDKTDSDTDWKGFYGGAATAKVPVAWSPNNNPFAKGQTYTATIDLNRKDANYKFVEPDDNTIVDTGFQVGADTAVKTTTTGEWTYTLADAKVTLKRTYPLTGITVEATLTATAWNTLTVTGFTAQTQSNVNLYYLIYSEAQSFADEAAVRAAYTTATAGSGNVIAKGTQADVKPTSGVASWSGGITVTDNGIVGDHTYYLYVVAEAVSDTSVLATNDDTDKTPKKLTVTHNGYGSVAWTVGGDSTKKNNTPAGPLAADTLTGSYTETTANKSQVISMFQDSTFTATPANATRFGFVKWTLKPTGGTAADAGTTNTYSYGTAARANDDTLHAIFHRKISGSFTIGITDGAAGAKVYTPSYANSVYIGSNPQAANALPADSAADYSTKGGIKYQWYENVSTSGTWTPISGATSLVYTNPANTYAGAAFKLVISYTDPDNGGIETSVEATTDVQTQKLATPQPVLSKVEHKTTGPDDSFIDQNGNAVDVAKGGLHLTFPRIAQDTASGNPVDYYIVNLKRGTTTVSSFPITAENKDNYYYYWEANGTTIDPTKVYTVEVKAVSKGDGGTGKDNLLDKATNGWLNSDWGKDEVGVNAGRRVLTMEDLAVTLTDRVFNGTAQTASPTAKLKSDRVGASQTKPIGTATFTYSNKPDNTDPDASPAANKTHVNITETTTPGGTTNDGNHSYYVYIAVAQGDLYLAMDNGLYTKTDTPDNKKATDWEIYQAKSTLNINDITCSDGEEQTLNPTVTYATGTSDIWNTGTGAAAKGNITRYYNITYSLPATLTPGTDYTLVGNKFTPLNPGISDYPITVTATYDDGEGGLATDQFKNDITEATKVIHVTVGAADLNGITAKWNRTATYGDSDSEESRLTGQTALDPNDTTDFYDAPNATTAKQMKLEGLTFVLDWAGEKPDQTIVLDATASNWPGTITASNVGGKAVTVGKGTDGMVTFPGAGTTTLTFAYNGKSVTLTYTLKTCPLPYTIYSDAEWIWNNSATVPAAANTTNNKTTYNVPAIPDNLAGDDVRVDVTRYETKASSASNAAANSNVGKDKTVRAVGPKVAGDQAAFYHLGAETPGQASIKPSLVTKLNVNQPEPSAVTTPAGNNSVTNNKYKPSITTKEDEKKITSNWSLSPTTTWEYWDKDANGGLGDWVAETDHFSIDTVYRATVKVQADTNHYLTNAVLASGNYTINGKKVGDYCIEDLDDWNTLEANRVTATVEESKPFHPDWLPDDEVLYHNIVTFTYVFHTYETPTLQFSDEKGRWNEESPAPKLGTDHKPGQYVHHDEIVKEGAPGMTYLIAVNASVKDIFGAQVLLTNDELLKAGATLKVVQGNGTINTALPVNPAQETPMYKVNSEPFKADQDLIIYELTIPSSLTAHEGEYHLEFQAMGSTSLENLKAGKIDVSKCYYTFTLIVQKEQIPPVIGETALPVVTYWLGGNGYTSDMTSEKMASVGARPTFVPTVVGLNGYHFKGWSETDPTLLKDGEKPKLVDPLTFSIREDKIFYAYYEKEGIDHTHYVVGYKDGTFQPNANITRAEVATIIARACLEGFEEGSDYGNPGEYSDVGAKKWYASAIAYTTMAGVFSGYKDGTFRPNQPITRQEFASVIGRMAGLLVNQGLPFEDASSVSKWARDGVYTVYKNGWVTGYTDGTFQPQGYLTRAEAVRVFNGYLNRGVDAEGLNGLTPYLLDAAAGGYESDGSSQYLTWSDVPERHWAYYEILEASNDHDFHWPDKKDATEKKDTPPEDWDKVYLDEQWRYRREFLVTFALADLGTTLAPTAVKVVENGTIKIAPTVTASEGYTFLGWSETDPALGEEIILVDPTAIAITADKVYYAVYEETRTEPRTYNVLFEAGRNGVLNGWPTVTVEENTVPTVSTVTADEGYVFLGWSETDPALGEEVTLVDPASIAITADKTYYAVYEERQEMPETYSVLFVAGENGALNEWPLFTVEANTAPTVPAVTANEGYTFLGWSETDPAQGGTVVLVNPATILITANKTYYAAYRQTQVEIPGQLYVHKAYFDGREEGRFDPKTAVTRAEIAAMLVRGWAADYDENAVYDVSGLSDIADHPYRNFIGYCLEKGIFSGYKDGTFDPDGSINRQEFASVLARLAGIQTNQGLPFTDADTIKKWARDAIYTVYVNGWMTGYADGTFRPKNEVTRAEAVRAFNNFLGRTLTREGIANVTEFDHIWTDVKVTNWAYLDIMEATHTHTYYILDGVEYWVDATDADLAAVESDHTEVADQGTPEEGSPEEGTPEEGAPEEGTPEGEVPEEGVPEEGASEEGTSDEESTQD